MPREKKCQAHDCDIIIKRAEVFCKMHWAWVDEDVKDKLIAAYVPGQAVVRGLKTRKWYAAVAEARMRLKELEKYGD